MLGMSFYLKQVFVYRHTADPLPFTSALCDTIAAVTTAGIHVLEQNLDGLTISLHNQVLAVFDVTLKQTMIVV